MKVHREYTVTLEFAGETFCLCTQHCQTPSRQTRREWPNHVHEPATP